MLWKKDPLKVTGDHLMSTSAVTGEEWETRFAQEVLMSTGSWSHWWVAREARMAVQMCVEIRRAVSASVERVRRFLGCGAW